MTNDGSGVINIADVLSALSPNYATGAAGTTQGVASATIRNGGGGLAFAALSETASNGLATFAPTPVPSGPVYARLFNEGWRGSTTPNLH